MKSFKLLLSFIVLVAVAAAPVVRAQSTPAPSSSSEAALTPEQQAKITELRKTARKEIKATKTDTKLKEADKEAKIKEIKEKLTKDIADVKAGK